MAKYDVTHICGHVETHSLFGKGKDREWKLGSLAHEPCSICQEAALAKRNEEKAAANSQAGLPPLTGSEKQVAWAESIRCDMLKVFEVFNFCWNLCEQRKELGSALKANEVNEIMREAGLDAAQYMPILLQLIKAAGLSRHADFRNALVDQLRASWWIDHRYMYDAVIADVTKELAAIPVKQDNTPAATEAREESIIRPDALKSSCIAELSIAGGKIRVSFAEKHDDFRATMKSLGLAWDGSAWSLTLSFRDGQPEDRLAEIAHRLVANGFAVSVFDEVARARALDGSFKPWTPRWVVIATAGEYEGWCCISWKAPDDFYNAARSLPRSRYSKGAVYVPVGAIEAVAEFAETYRFGLSPKTLELLEAHRAALATGAVLTKTLEAPVPLSGIGSAKDVVLPAPVNCDVDPALMDND